MHTDAALLDPTPQAATTSLSMEEWAREEGLVTARGEIDYAAIGERIGKDRTTVYRTLTGKMPASSSFIEASIVESGGRIDANTFFRKAHSNAAASRGVTPSGPFSSTSSPDPGRPVPRHASGGSDRPTRRPASLSPARTPLALPSSKRCRP